MPRSLGVVCLSAWVGSLTACSLLFDPIDGPADQPPCAGLSLLQDDFADDLDAEHWWMSADEPASFSLESDGLHLTTGLGQSERGAAFGTYEFYEARGALVFEIASLEATDGSAFFVRLDSRSGSYVVVSLSGGALSLVDHDSMSFDPEYPIWLALSLQEGRAELSTSVDGRDFATVMQQPFDAEEVTAMAGLTASQSDAPAEHSMILGSMGSPAPPGCME